MRGAHRAHRAASSSGPGRTAGLASVLVLGVALSGCGLSDSVATPTPPASAAATDSATPDPTTAAPTPSEAPTSAPATEEPQPSSSPTDGAGSGTDTPSTAQTATLLFSGEVLMHQSLIDQALHNAGGRNFDFRPMFDEIRDIVTAADLAVCHLELPVIPDGQGMEPRYATPPQVIDAVADAGFDRCSTASNHILDRGTQGIDATLKAFDRTGMTQAGTARNQREAAAMTTEVLDVKGFKVAHLSFTEVDGLPAPSNQKWRVSEAGRSVIKADIAKARKAGAEYVVVSIHDADELAYSPTVNQTKWDEWLLDEGGADLVVGTGSHVPEPLEERNGGFALFGVGNLINWRLDARASTLALVTLTRQADGSIKALTPNLIPTFTVERMGYQVVDARLYKEKKYDAATRRDLKQVYDKLKPIIGQWVPGA
jgi:poly-gamma-glutamate synthesis protein (capsule biosynthesis protein)